MNDPAVIAAAVVTVIAALAAAVVTVTNAMAAAADRRDARASRAVLATTTHATEKKADIIIEKAVEIHALTNSHLSTVTAALNVALAEIKGLQSLVSSLLDAKRIADTLATAAAAATPPARAPDQRRREDEQTLHRVDVTTQKTLQAVTHEGGPPVDPAA
jgi:hypothetical protein